MVATDIPLFRRASEFLNCQICGADQTSQRASGNFLVIRHRQRRDLTSFGHDNVAGLLTRYLPTKPFEGPHNFAATQHRHLRRHQTVTSTCPVSMVSGKPCSARTSRQTFIAFLMFFIASCFVRPWLTQPGIEGHSTTQTPSSSRSIVM